MALLLRWLIRRFRWLAAGAVVRTLTRRYSDASIAAATEEIHDRLPTRVADALEALPGDATRVAGSALAAQRAAASAARVSTRAGSATARGTRKALTTKQRLHAFRTALGRDLHSEVDRSHRELSAEALRDAGEVAEADELLLDRRDAIVDVDPFDRVSDPVPSGRARRPLRPAALVQRVQRTYQRPVKPWEIGSARRAARHSHPELDR